MAVLGFKSGKLRECRKALPERKATTSSVDSQAGNIMEVTNVITVSSLQEDIGNGKPVVLPLLCL